MSEQMVEIPASEHQILTAIAELLADAATAEKYPEFGKEMSVDPAANIERAKELVDAWQSWPKTPLN